MSRSIGLCLCRFGEVEVNFHVPFESEPLSMFESSMEVFVAFIFGRSHFASESAPSDNIIIISIIVISIIVISIIVIEHERTKMKRKKINRDSKKKMNQSNENL